MSYPSIAPSVPDDVDPMDLKNKYKGNMHWGARCLLYGPKTEEKQKANGTARIPWVTDFNVMESDDNVGLGPMHRHYFDTTGLESSFRNRGRHYGRAKKYPFAMNGPKPGEHVAFLKGPAPFR